MDQGKNIFACKYIIHLFNKSSTIFSIVTFLCGAYQIVKPQRKFYTIEAFL